MAINKFPLYPVKVKLYTTNDASFIVEFCAGLKEGEADEGSASFALSDRTALNLANAIIKLYTKKGKGGEAVKITVH